MRRIDLMRYNINNRKMITSIIFLMSVYMIIKLYEAKDIAIKLWDYDAEDQLQESENMGAKLWDSSVALLNVESLLSGSIWWYFMEEETKPVESSVKVILV